MLAAGTPVVSTYAHHAHTWFLGHLPSAHLLSWLAAHLQVWAPVLVCRCQKSNRLLQQPGQSRRRLLGSARRLTHRSVEPGHCAPAFMAAYAFHHILSTEKMKKAVMESREKVEAISWSQKDSSQER